MPVSSASNVLQPTVVAPVRVATSALCVLLTQGATTVYFQVGWTALTCLLSLVRTTDDGLMHLLPSSNGDAALLQHDATRESKVDLQYFVLPPYFVPLGVDVLLSTNNWQTVTRVGSLACHCLHPPRLMDGLDHTSFEPQATNTHASFLQYITVVYGKCLVQPSNPQQSNTVSNPQPLLRQEAASAQWRLYPARRAPLTARLHRPMQSEKECPKGTDKGPRQGSTTPGDLPGVAGDWCWSC